MTRRQGVPRILIAEDDASIRRMLAVSLSKNGYRTADACDGVEALEVMRAGDTDLVLLDLMMPRVTGWEVLSERKGSPELQKIPVIVITAERGPLVGKLTEDGSCALLHKPFELHMLYALVEACLDAA